jgi:hypothetical protein
MDKNQHLTQDAAEPYAVYVMAEASSQLGVLGNQNSRELWKQFLDYLSKVGWSERDFVKFYPMYKNNVDNQIPKFIERLAALDSKAKYTFQLDEVEQRNAGNKADFIIRVDNNDKPLMVSLKNYIGSGGIKRPQVSSGTFLSFANGFIFDRNGVGTYSFPNQAESSFKGSIKSDRDLALKELNLEKLAQNLDSLNDLQQLVRNELLGLRFYDQNKVRAVIEEIVPQAQRALLSIFDTLGPEKVKLKFLERANLRGAEHILYFDSANSVDSITSEKFAELYKLLNSPETILSVSARGQSLVFDFVHNGNVLLSNQVPLTVNTNGAWHRPNEKYSGTQEKLDKGVLVHLEYGEIRPRKSKEIATSTNLYMDLASAQVFN